MYTSAANDKQMYTYIYVYIYIRIVHIGDLEMKLADLYRMNGMMKPLHKLSVKTGGVCEGLGV